MEIGQGKYAIMEIEYSLLFNFDEPERIVSWVTHWVKKEREINIFNINK